MDNIPLFKSKTVKHDERGFALILTILIISLITVVTFQFNDDMQYETDSAANLKYGAQLNCIARSGFNYALALLFEDAVSTNYDSLLEPWANLEMFTPDHVSAFEEMSFQAKIFDHSGRINVNKILDQNQEVVAERQEILERLFLSLENPKIEMDEVDDIIQSLIDWIDTDDNVTGVGGAEGSYYQGKDPPYSCRNAPLETLDELLLIKGFTREIYDQVSRYLTVHGDGEININTADARVLAALHEDMDDELAADMVEYRKTADDQDLETIDWYKNVSGINAKGINLNNISISSTHFEIISIGSFKKMRKLNQGMVERDNSRPPRLTVLSRKVL